MVHTTPSTKNDNHVLHEVKYEPIIDTNYQQFEPETEAKKPDTWFLLFVVLIGSTPSLVGATSNTWSSSAIIKLKSNDSNVNPFGQPVTTSDISLLLGVPGLIALLGSSMLPKLADIMGRKGTLLLIGSTTFLGVVGTAFSYRIELMIFFLSIHISSFSSMMSVFPTYLTEISEDHNRAKYGCIFAISFPLGQLYSYSIGPLFNLRTFTLLSAAPMIPFLLLFFFAPESPVYSLGKGKRQECVQSLRKLRNYNSEKELEFDLKNIEKTTLITNQTEGSSFKKLVFTKEGRIGVMLGMLPVLIQYISGVPVIMPLLAPILNNSGSIISGSAIAVCVGIVKVISFSFTSLIVERFGRKPLLIVSAASAGVPISVLGLYFYLVHINSPIVIHIQWLPLVCVLLYFISYSLGLGPIPMSLISVLFPSDLRSVASAFIITTINLIISVYLAIYPLLAEAIGTHWCMWIFGVTCFAGAITFYILMVETKGKGTLEIQNMLKDY